MVLSCILVGRLIVFKDCFDIIFKKGGNKMLISATERIEDFAITVNKRLLTFCDTGWSYSKIVSDKENPDQQWKGKNGEKIFAKTIIFVKNMQIK